MATRPTSPRQTNAPHVQPATSVVTPQQTSVGVVCVIVTALNYMEKHGFIRELRPLFFIYENGPHNVCFVLIFKLKLLIYVDFYPPR